MLDVKISKFLTKFKRYFKNQNKIVRFFYKKQNLAAFVIILLQAFLL